MTDQPNFTRHLDLRITAGGEVGFIVWEASEVVAAVTSRAELADWIEHRLGLVPGEAEREARELAAYRAATERQVSDGKPPPTNVERFPNVAGGRTMPPERRRRFW